MECNYQNFKKLKIDSSLISLEPTDNMYDYFCYPLNASPIGLEGCILYCFIDGCGDMVFASNPESCADINVYPLAKNFTDFMRLIIVCGSANPAEQAVWMSKTQFEQHLISEEECRTEAHNNVIKTIAEKFDLHPMDNPYEYIKSVQRDFDYSKIIFSDEYYDIKGIEKKTDTE